MRPWRLLSRVLHSDEERHRLLAVELLFEARDLWVGAYWDRRDRSLRHPVPPRYDIVTRWKEWHLYVCAVPTLPVHVVFEWGWRTRLEDRK